MDYLFFISILIVFIILIYERKRFVIALIAKKIFFRENKEIMGILEKLSSEQANVAINCFDSNETIKGIIISVDDNFVTVQTEKKGIKNEVTLNKLYIKNVYVIIGADLTVGYRINSRCRNSTARGAAR